MIEGPGLMTLDHSLCVYRKTTWSHLDLMQLPIAWGKVREEVFRQLGWPQLSLSLSSNSFANNMQHWRVPIYVLIIYNRRIAKGVNVRAVDMSCLELPYPGDHVHADHKRSL